MRKPAQFLVIDDSKTMQAQYALLLQKAGHKVAMLDSCDQAMDLIKQLQPDCILCDLLLPGLDSLELFSMIRREPHIKQPAFIVISGKQFDYDRKYSLNLGVDAYFTKPINQDSFIEDIFQIIEGKMTIQFWGCRGTFPVPGEKTVRYGGNTNCISLQIGNKPWFIFDAGTGIKELSNYLLAENKTPLNAKIFITHPHYDHINGIPYFAPLYIKGNNFEFLGPDQEKVTLETYLAKQMDSVYFPVNMKEFSANVSFRSLTEENLIIDEVQVDTILLNHPGRCLGYRISYKNRIFCYITDNELALNDEKTDYQEEEVQRLTRFIHKADLVVMDCTYTDEEYLTKINWGHSPLSSVVEVAHLAQVKLLCLYHHDPNQTDDDIDKKLETALALLKEKNSSTQCIAPYEGMELVL